MDIEALERKIQFTKQSIPVQRYFIISIEMAEDLIAAAKREQALRSLLEQTHHYVRICALGFREVDEEAKALLYKIEEALSLNSQVILDG